MTARDVAAALPGIPVLRDRCRALAVLDAILSPAWESRYFSLDSRWSPGHEVASMRDGSGDEYSIVFNAAGVETGDDRWHTGDVDYPAGPAPDGADDLFAVLVEGTPDAYRRFAEDYYEQPVDADAVRAVYASAPLTDALVRRLNPDLTLRDLADDLADDLAEIGCRTRQ